MVIHWIPVPWSEKKKKKRINKIVTVAAGFCCCYCCVSQLQVHCSIFQPQLMKLNNLCHFQKKIQSLQQSILQDCYLNTTWQLTKSLCKHESESWCTCTQGNIMPIHLFYWIFAWLDAYVATPTPRHHRQLTSRNPDCLHCNRNNNISSELWISQLFYYVSWSKEQQEADCPNINKNTSLQINYKHNY